MDEIKKDLKNNLRNTIIRDHHTRLEIKYHNVMFEQIKMQP